MMDPWQKNRIMNMLEKVKKEKHHAEAVGSIEGLKEAEKQEAAIRKFVWATYRVEI